MAEFIKLKNAHRRIHEIFLNGLRQRRSLDYALTSKGVRLNGNFPRDKKDLVTLVVEENYIL